MTAGGRSHDAVGVCAHELADPQLGLFLARLLSDSTNALAALINQELLPGASQEQIWTTCQAQLTQDRFPGRGWSPAAKCLWT